MPELKARPVVRGTLIGVAVTVAALVALQSTVARAQGGDGPPGGDVGSGGASTEAEARSLFEVGVRYVEQERWGEALEYFRRSREMMERPSTVFNMAVALLRLGRPTEGVRALDDYLRMAEGAGEEGRRAEARRLLEPALASIARIQLQISPSDADVRIDDQVIAGEGAEREIPLDPGEHVVTLSAAGFETMRQRWSVLDGERSSRQLTLVALPPRPERGRLSVTTSVTGASIVVDGEVIATDSWIGEVPSGRHQIEVRADGHHAFRRVVEVLDGEALQVHASLQALPNAPVSIWEEPLFWVVTGSVALAAVGTGLAFAYGGGTEAPYGGSTGVVLQGLRFP